MSRGPALRLLIGASVLAFALAATGWLASRVEWVEHEVPTPARGEALSRTLYAAERLAERLGARTAHPTTLHALPPPQGTLWLTSWHWDLFPETSAQLRAWVEAGGHLVVPALTLGDSLDWVPVHTVTAAQASDEEEEEDDENTPEPCRLVVEPDALPAALGDRRGYRLCDPSDTRLLADDGAEVLWAAGAPPRPETTATAELLRVRVGRGRVTVIGPFGPFDNARLFRGDHPALMAAALQLRAGDTVWFVQEESRPPLLAWLWQRGAPALALGALALLAALWRGAVRFGPVVAVHAPARRSMAEQVRGTAQFLGRHGRTALHRAQVQALEDTARLVLPRTAAVLSATSLARATGLAADPLAAALDPEAARTPQSLAAALGLLEAARRRLHEAARDGSLRRRLTPSPEKDSA